MGRTIITIQITDEQYNMINGLVNNGLYLSRSDFIREAIKMRLDKLDRLII